MNKKSNVKEQQTSATNDKLLWFVVALLVCVGIGADFYFASQSLSLRLAGLLVLVCVAGVVASRTKMGVVALEFIKLSRMEMRKIVWPNRQETVQTTLAVIGMVIIMALILWGADTFLLWLIGMLTGQV